MYALDKLAKAFAKKKPAQRVSPIHRDAVHALTGGAILSTRVSLSRRAVLSGGGVATLGAGSGGPGRIRIDETDDGLLLGMDTWKWAVRRGAFGEAARLSVRRQRNVIYLRVHNAALLPSNPCFDLDIELSPGKRLGKGTGWRIVLRAPELGIKSSEWLDDFLAGGGITVRLGRSVAARFAGNLGWKSVREVKRLTLRPDLTWQLAGSSPFLCMGNAISARALVLATHPPGQGPQDHLLEAALQTWSGSATAEDCAPTAERQFRGSHRDADVTLRTLNRPHVAVQVWQDQLQTSSTMVRGAWQMELDHRRHGRLARFSLDQGVMLQGARGDEAHHAMLLLLDKKPFVLDLPGASLDVRGVGAHHGVSLAALNGNIQALELRGAIVTASTHVSGADYNSFVFANQELVVLAGRAAARVSGTAAGNGDAATVDLATLASSIPLDKAHLTLMRAQDLLNVTFKFRKMVWRPSASYSAGRLYPTTQTLADALRAESDDRPVLLAILPPQHIIEVAHFRQLQSDVDSLDYPNVQLDPWPPLDKNGNALGTREAIECYKENLQPDYAAFRAKYQSVAGKAYFPLDPPLPDAVPKKDSPDSDLVQKALKALYADKYEEDEGEPLEDVVEAHTADCSRLAFTIGLNGQLAPRRDHFDLDLEDLTNWAELEPVVASPAKSWEYYKAKNPSTKPPATEAERIRQLLHFHGIEPNQDRQTRMDAVTRQITEPDDFVTAIEIPGRLILSPSQAARFQTSKFDKDALSNGKPVPAWTARLRVEDGVSGDLRAIYSPDFKAETFYSADLNFPGRPPKDTGEPTPAPSAEDITPWDEEGSTSPRRLRLTLNKRDRHELVALTSLYGLPVLPRLTTAGGVRTPPTAVVQSSFDLNDFASGHEITQGVYLPPPLEARELTLTGLGGSADLLGTFEPPASPYRTDESKAKGLGAYPALNIEGFRQRTVLSYDHNVQVLYKGFLFPLGVRVSLVKETERFTLKRGGSLEPPITYLIQHKYLRLPADERRYPGPGHPFDAHDLPFASIRLLGGRSPDIVDPEIHGNPPEGKLVEPNGAIRLSGGGLGLVFWPRTAAQENAEIHFKFAPGENSGALTVPLIFADNTAVHDPRTMAALVDYYQTIDATSALRTAVAAGLPVRYAPEKQPGGCTFETERILLGVRGRGDVPADSGAREQYKMTPEMEGKDQPPFYPWMMEGHVHVRTLQRFLDSPSGAVRVSHHKLFREHGFDGAANPGFLYLSVHGQRNNAPKNWFEPAPAPVVMNLSGRTARSGGAVNPAIVVTAIGRDNGPVGGGAPLPPLVPPLAPVKPALGAKGQAGGETPPAATAPAPTGAESGLFDPRDFFHTDAKLLGLLPLKDVLQAALFATAPELMEQIDSVGQELQAEADKIKGQLHDVVDDLGTWAKDGVAALQIATEKVAAVLDQKVGDITVRQLYPDLAKANDVLSEKTGEKGSFKSVSKAIVAAQAALNAESKASITALNDLANATRLFNAALAEELRQLEKIAANPIPAALVTFLGDLKRYIALLGSFVPALLLDTVLKEGQAQLDKILPPAGTPGDGYAVWRTLVFGTEANQRPKDFKSADPRTYETAFAQMAQALAYEAVGAPLVAGFRQCHALLKGEADDAARSLQARIFKTLNALFGAADALLGSTQMRALLAAAGTTCEQLATQVAGAAQDVLAGQEKIGSVVTDLEAAVNELGKLEARARDFLTGLSKPGALPPKDLETLKLLVSRISQMRKAAGAGLDRVKTDLALVDVERIKLADLAKEAAKSCSAGVLSQDMAAALGRLSVQRLRAIEATGQMFAVLQGGLTDLLDTVDLPDPSGSIQARMRAPRGAASSSIADLAGQAVSDAGKLFKALIQIPEQISSLSAAPDHALEQAKVIAATIKDDVRRAGQLDDSVKLLREHKIPAVQANITRGVSLINAGNVAEGGRLLANSAGDIGLLSREHEQSFLGLISTAFALQAGAVEDLETFTCKVLAGALKPLVSAYDSAMQCLASLEKLEPDVTGPLRVLLNRDLLTLLAGLDEALGQEKIALQGAYDLLVKVQGEPSPKDRQKDITAALQAVQAFLLKSDPAKPDPAKPEPAMARLLNTLNQLYDILLHGHVGAIFKDLDGVKRDLVKYAVATAFPNVVVSYSLHSKIGGLPPFFSMREGLQPPQTFEFQDDILVTFKASLSPAAGQARMTAVGQLQPFRVDIFEVVTLDFKRCTFTAGTGQDTHLDLQIENVTLGPVVDFLSALGNWLSPSGSGFFLTPQFSPPGIEAGFVLDLGTICLGEMSFLYVSVAASVELPFDDRPALFRTGIGRREAPVGLCCMPMGGFAFLALVSDSKNIVGFEFSCEYGAVVAFKFGPLEAIGSVTTGIYVARIYDSAKLTGFFQAAGNAHIACFGVSACLLVSVEQADGGAMRGSATFTFTFKVAFVHYSYSVGVSRTIDQGWGAGGNGASHKAPRGGYPRLLAVNAPASRLPAQPPPTIQCSTVLMNDDWNAYLSYFED